MSLHLILGGARSGKSGHAERLAIAAGTPVTYIATARAGDAEMRARIAHHRAQRPAHWQTAEAPLELAGALRRHAAPGRLVIVDCLTLWLTNLLFDGREHEAAEGVIEPPPAYAREHAALLEALPGLPGTVLCVSNEIGFGVVPLGALTRFFTDEMGRLNQAVAAQAQRVTLMVAGLPLELKA
ncbi:MAG TPA: bifunctional adenosylcobinamide kinase/adenosylcobinamide-phosphate guanylyltransferase [Burkholderiales bacterium]